MNKNEQTENEQKWTNFENEQTLKMNKLTRVG